MLIPFGILSAGAGGPVGDYDLIESVFLSATTASVTFSNLGDYSSVYKHFQIRAVVRGATASGNVNTFLRINADTGSNYSEHGAYGASTSVTAYGTSSTSSIFFGTVPAASAPANAFSNVVIDLLEPYSTTKHKTIKYMSGYQSQVAFGSGQRRNTESTTSLTLLPAVGSWAASSRFSIYGIKG